jgi:hypothetical protein
MYDMRLEKASPQAKAEPKVGKEVIDKLNSV